MIFIGNFKYRNTFLIKYYLLVMEVVNYFFTF